MSDSKDEQRFFWLERERVWFVCGSNEERFLNLADETVATVRIASREVRAFW